MLFKSIPSVLLLFPKKLMLWNTLISIYQNETYYKTRKTSVENCYNTGLIATQTNRRIWCKWHNTLNEHCQAVNNWEKPAIFHNNNYGKKNNKKKMIFKSIGRRIKNNEIPFHALYYTHTHTHIQANKHPHVFKHKLLLTLFYSDTRWRHY